MLNFGGSSTKLYYALAFLKSGELSVSMSLASFGGVRLSLASGVICGGCSSSAAGADCLNNAIFTVGSAC